MDSDFPKHKHLKRQKEIDGGEDTISRLPESLIIRILSILPTKDAVRTSVLSKRWRYMWMSITKLDLDDSVFCSHKKKTGGKQYFVNFVYRALLLTKSQPLESFTLVIGSNHYTYDVSLVNTWICNVLNRSLKRLCIHSQMELPFSDLTSNCLLYDSSELLVELVLNMHRCATVTVSNSYVHFGNLKLLKLSGVAFRFGCSNYSKGFDFSFPLLRKLEAVNCTWLGAKRVTFKVPLVESVFIGQGSDPETQPQFHKLNICPIEFSASHLTEFTYCGYGCISQSITLIDPSSAHNASATIILSEVGWDRFEETEFRAFLLLKQFSQVKYLKFEGSEILPQSRLAALPAFGMLNHLELGLVGGEVLLDLLLKSPVLKTLIFKGLVSKFDLKLLNSAVVPDCLQQTLEVVKFGEVEGHEHELCLAKFVMENGLVLKRMSFSVAAQIGKSKAFEEFKEKLFSFKKGFSFFVVEFSYI